MPAVESRCKPQAGHAPYKPCNPCILSSKDTPRSSAQSLQPQCKENLTLHDWMTVFAYFDAHSKISQDAVVKHF
ncbi:hypothetical protein J3R83DRAFT_3776, partial [Lanmaoa asiatica]